MDTDYPLVSIIMATYNRAKTIKRAINSVLNQTYKNIELIIVDDGSSDNTFEILQDYHDPRIRIFKHESNKGVTAAKNSGLRLIRGDWFTTFDSDDEMVPEAIETMMDVPLFFDKSITSVTCNCYLGYSDDFSGRGIDRDCYIKANDVMPLTTGDFWGINRTCLLEGDTFNENLNGIESTLWYRLNERANCYYIHRALNIIHLEGIDRVSVKRTSLEKKFRHFKSLIDESLYLGITKRYKPGEYLDLCRIGFIVMRAYRDQESAARYYKLMKEFKKYSLLNLILGIKLPAALYKVYLNSHPSIK